MHGLAALYLGYFIYLVIYLRCQKPSEMARKITIFLGVKLVILTAIYFLFFHHKISKYERHKNWEKLIINQQ